MAKKKYIETPEKMWEIWKPIDFAIGYEVSNLGNIRSYKKRNSTELYSEPEIISQGIIKTHCKEYKRVSLRIDGKTKSYYVHRIVAMTFIENTFNKPQVHHIDNNEQNNCVTNLQWVDNSENQRARFGGKFPSVCLDRGSFRVYFSKSNVRGSKSFKTFCDAFNFSRQVYA
jgi:hypothetical protein